MNKDNDRGYFYVVGDCIARKMVVAFLGHGAWKEVNLRSVFIE